MANASLTEEIDDLSTCCICMDPYDDGARKPKFLTCFHTYCLACLKRMIRQLLSAQQVTCPKCKAICMLPQRAGALHSYMGPEQFTTNVYALNNIQLKNLLENASYWCLACGSTAKTSCFAQEHSIGDFSIDVQEIETLEPQVLTHLYAAISKREEVEIYLESLEESLESPSQSDVIKALKVQNKIRLQMLRSKVKKFIEKKNRTKSFSSIWNELKEINQKAKTEGEDATRLLNIVISNSDQGTILSGISTSALNEFENSRSSRFEASQIDTLQSFSADWLGSSCDPLRFKDLLAHTDAVTAAEFSDDGSILVSCGADKRILLWRVNDCLKDGQPKPTELEKKLVNCLTINPDSSRIFLCASNGEIVIRDIETAANWCSISAPEDASFKAHGMSLQAGSNGNIFVTAIRNKGFLYLFDIRLKQTDQVVQTIDKCYPLNSVMFSPVVGDHLVTAGLNGIEVIDIRHSIRPIFHESPWGNGSLSAQYSPNGSRILCSEALISGLIIHDLSKDDHNSRRDGIGTVSLTAHRFANRWMGIDSKCFAGNELIAAAAEDKNLYFWSAPESDDAALSLRLIDKPIVILHSQHQNAISSVRYSSRSCTLASADRNGIIKLWTSK